MDVTVCVATYGSKEWADLAHEGAIPSIDALGVPWVHAHYRTLQESRNAALAGVQTEHVAFVDADDALEDGYFEAIERSTADLRVPGVRYVGLARTVPPARMPRVVNHRHDCTADCLAYGNWMVIGTVAPTALLRQVGGFRDFPWAEDWDLWVRCWKAGATIEAVPDAVYRATVRRDSRNRAPSRAEIIEAHNAIARANDLPLVAA